MPESSRDDGGGPLAPRLVLASGSPQRRAILALLGLAFEVRPTDAPEQEQGDPVEVARENARRKAVAARARPGETVLAVDTKVFGFAGNFDAIRWGIQKSIGLELIKYGDPDGGGDLKRNNQVAFRTEVVYGWGVADLNAIAKIHDLV